MQTLQQTAIRGLFKIGASLAVLILGHRPIALADDLAGQASVIDGDTLEIHGTRIRLWGVDAPESSQLCRGEESLQHQCGANPETREGYLPGFSFSVVARSIREARRLDGLPTPGAFLKICARHRRLFKAWQADVMRLMNIRSDAIYGEVPF